VFRIGRIYLSHRLYCDIRGTLLGFPAYRLPVKAAYATRRMEIPMSAIDPLPVPGGAPVRLTEYAACAG